MDTIVNTSLENLEQEIRNLNSYWDQLSQELVEVDNESSKILNLLGFNSYNQYCLSMDIAELGSDWTFEILPINTSLSVVGNTDSDPGNQSLRIWVVEWKQLRDQYSRGGVKTMHRLTCLPREFRPSVVKKLPEYISHLTNQVANLHKMFKNKE